MGLRMMFSLLMLGCLAFIEGASAEGRCPPGQYPVASNGCAPIPGYGAGQAQQAPRVIHRTIYLESHGAIAIEPKSGEYEFVVGRSSKSDAKKDAIAGCNARIGGGCKHLMWFMNGCAVLAWGDNQVFTASSETKDEAISEVRENCSNGGVPSCEIIETKCSIPQAPPS